MGGGLGSRFSWNSPIALAYCWPRKISSASFSRWAICRHVGIATVIMMAMMLSATMSATLA
jgi:hypothetical protein